MLSINRSYYVNCHKDTRVDTIESTRRKQQEEILDGKIKLWFC